MKDKVKEVLKECGENRVMYLVHCYLEMNGIIDRDILKNLLAMYHNIDISLSELDRNVKLVDCSIYGDYYTIVNKEDFVNDLIPIKLQHKDYKVFSDDIEIIDEEFYTNLKMVCDNDEVLSTLLLFVKSGLYNKNFIEKLLKDEYRFSKSQTKEIIDVIKIFKNKLSLWTYNGYSIDELSVEQKKKSGRNEPCPCGSGKKYKQCCGK